VRVAPVFFLLFAACFAACGASEGAIDAATPGAHDDAAAERDATVIDTGTTAPDAAAADAAADIPDAGRADPDAAMMVTDGGQPPSCPPNVRCVSTFPFHDQANTATEGASLLAAYDCSPSTNEGGPEIVYQVDVPADGFLSAAVTDGAGVDIDLHILRAIDAQQCLDRGDKHVSADVTAGRYYVVADSFVSGGTAQSGDYELDIGFMIPSQGACEMEVGEMARVNDGGNHLAMPATGPIVLEAHLVTQDEPPPYPMTSTEELAEHYAHSQEVSGLVMSRSQVWAPLEGGSFYGAGIGSPTLFPAAHEAWYVNMYWTSAARPARGTKMILRNGTRAVVVAAGYESGPGNLTHIAGTPEETHFYMGTRHLSPMTIGIAVDQTLPYGPRVCP